MLKEGYFENVYYRFFSVEKPNANIFAIHGLGGHCLWFDKAANKFNEKEINFFSFDLPGFGQSKYALGMIDSYELWINKSREVIWKFLNSYKINKPVFVLGHSMGALIAIILAINVKAGGWILSVPGFEGHVRSFPLSFVIPMFLNSLINPKRGLTTPFGPELLTKNKEIQRKLKEDPFRVINPSARTFFQVYLLSNKAKAKCKSLLEPVLMLVAADDVVCSNSAMYKYFNEIGSNDKIKKVYKNSYHDVFVEDALNVLVEDVSSWIKERI